MRGLSSAPASRWVCSRSRTAISIPRGPSRCLLLGGLFCGERTIEHLSLYREDVEAVFWGDAAECAEKCLWLLADVERRNAIAAAGHRKVLSQDVSNERVLSRVLDDALGEAAHPADRN